MCEYCNLKHELDSWGKDICKLKIDAGALGDIEASVKICVKESTLFSNIMAGNAVAELDVPINYCPVCGRNLHVNFSPHA